MWETRGGCGGGNRLRITSKVSFPPIANKSFFGCVAFHTAAHAHDECWPLQMPAAAERHAPGHSRKIFDLCERLRQFVRLVIGRCLPDGLGEQPHRVVTEHCY